MEKGSNLSDEPVLQILSKNLNQPGNDTTGDDVAYDLASELFSEEIGRSHAGSSALGLPLVVRGIFLDRDVAQCSHEHMPFTFEIRPLGLDQGFSISCPGVLDEDARRLRLIDAIVHAAQLGRDLEGSIQIFDAAGKLAEVLSLPRTPALAD